MIPNHTRTGIAHNLTYLRLHLRLVAVDRTDLASRLLLSELAMVQTLTGIVKQGRTLFAKPFVARVLFPITVDLYHLPYCFLLLLYPCHSLAKDTNFFISAMRVMAKSATQRAASKGSFRHGWSIP